MMKFRAFLFGAFGALLLQLPAAAADSSDVVGTWQVDVETFRTQMEEMIQAQLVGLPEAQRAQAMAMAEAQIDGMLARMEGEAEFRPDGTVVFSSPSAPKSEGTWSLDGDRITLQRNQPEPGEPDYIGHLEGDVIEVRPEQVQSGGPEVVFKLVRK